MPENGIDFEGRAPDERVEGFAGRLEVIEGPSGRRSWSDDVKVRIVQESFRPRTMVSEVARRHRISPRHLTRWRRAAREGRLSTSSRSEGKAKDAPFVPLAITAEQGDLTFVASERIAIEVNGVAVNLPAKIAASRIAEIVFALDMRR